jgi:hypothetical protein
MILHGIFLFIRMTWNEKNIDETAGLQNDDSNNCFLSPVWLWCWDGKFSNSFQQQHLPGMLSTDLFNAFSSRATASVVGVGIVNAEEGQRSG